MGKPTVHTHTRKGGGGDNNKHDKLYQNANIKMLNNLNLPIVRGTFPEVDSPFFFKTTRRNFV